MGLLQQDVEFALQEVGAVGCVKKFLKRVSWATVESAEVVHKTLQRIISVRFQDFWVPAWAPEGFEGSGLGVERSEVSSVLMLSSCVVGCLPF